MKVVSSRNIHFGRRKINRARAYVVFRRWKEYLPSDRGHEYASQFPQTNLMQYFAQRFIVYGRGSALQIISFSKPVLINGVVTHTNCQQEKKYHL